MLENQGREATILVNTLTIIFVLIALIARLGPAISMKYRRPTVFKRG